jgi:hypothetical protein
VFGNFTWRNLVALAWLTVTLIVSLCAVGYVPRIFVWLCAAGVILISAGIGAIRTRTGRMYPYFGKWNWIEGLLATTGCTLMFASCIGMLVAS